MEDQVFDQCMERIRQGDKDALKEIYIAYGGYVFHLILGILGNRENAEDVTSEFFIKLWDIADKYVSGTGHRGWLSRIARNMAIDFLRANKRELPYDMEEPEFETAADNGENTTEDTVIGEMTVEEALSQLKPAEREVVHLKVIGQFTFEEIAKMLGSPMGTVTWRYREAMKKLRRCGYET